MMKLKTEQLLLLELLTYLHANAPLKDIVTCKGMTVGQMVGAMDRNRLIAEKDYGSFITGAEWKNILQAMQNEPVVRNMRIVDTHIDRNQGGGGGKSAVLICDEYKEAVVAFRGTASAEWADDFLGATVETTIQQENALQWYREVYQKHQLSDYYVTVIGHSKGGNKAKFITIMDDTPDRCVSFDGQGFSDKFIRRYQDRIRLRQSVIENHNIDYDYVNILLNDIGERYYYKGYDYGRGGLAESHCMNTFFEFHEGGDYTINRNEQGQSPEMQEMDKFMNAYFRSMPSDQEAIESAELMGRLVERAFNLKAIGDTVTDYVNFICEMVSDSTYNDNVAFLFAFIINYERQHPGFMDNVTSVLKFFNMEGLERYVRMVQGMLNFPGLNRMLQVAGFFSRHLPDPALRSIQDFMKSRYEVALSREQIEGMLSIILQLKKTLNVLEIRDEGIDLTVEMLEKEHPVESV